MRGKEVSLFTKYSLMRITPAPYKEEILRPIADGKDPNTGKVIALQDYQEVYPTIKF